MEPTPPPDALAEIKAVVGRAKRGDASAVPLLRALLDRHPVIWQKYGDLAAQVEQSWVGLASGDDLHLRESVTRYAAKLRAELTRPSASPVEKLLVERAVASWLQLHYFSALEANAIAGDASPKLLQLRAKRQGQAQRQHERALSALVTYQKLFPDVPVKEVVPIPAPAPAAVAARRSGPLVLDAGSDPETTGPEQVESFESTPAHRPEERVRVGVSN
jgi:hypothetical protein